MDRSLVSTARGRSPVPAAGPHRPHGSGAALWARGAVPPGPSGPSAEREALYAEFQPLVRRLLRQYGDNRDAREDLVGEIYCRFCELYDAYDPARGVPRRLYLVRTLSASVYTYSRRQWRNKQRELLVDGDTELPETALDLTHAWDHKLLLDSVLCSVPAALARLPPRQRQVVFWRYYESRSFNEIADTLQIRPATARSLLRHALRNLRRMIAPTED
ncbi:MAG: sigma-70 family RNA polymerase sigma factor [Armatimonadota bacterium]